MGDNTCKFCKKSFKMLNTLSVHQCVKKRRHHDADLPSSRIGLYVFQRFYQLTTANKQPKTLDDFICSNYYLEFVKFAHYLVALSPIDMNAFIDHVIRDGVKLKDWTSEAVYTRFVSDIVKREPADRAVERTIITMAEWADRNNMQISDFFLNVSASEAVFLIIRGKLSPWVLYLSGTADVLMGKFTDEHASAIDMFISPEFWQKKFSVNSGDVDFISDVLLASGV